METRRLKTKNDRSFHSLGRLSAYDLWREGRGTKKQKIEDRKQPKKHILFYNHSYKQRASLIKTKMDKSELIIYTDGAAKGNPGTAGIGIIIYKGKNILKKLYNYIGKTTNNVAEYTALIYALQEALYLNADKVTIFSDSELIVKQIKGEYKVKDQNLRVFNGIAKHLIKIFPDFNINYIPREKNKEADALANKAIRESEDR